jgi:hypothetical protein
VEGEVREDGYVEAAWDERETHSFPHSALTG